MDAVAVGAARGLLAFLLFLLCAAIYGDGSSRKRNGALLLTFIAVGAMVGGS